MWISQSGLCNHHLLGIKQLRTACSLPDSVSHLQCGPGHLLLILAVWCNTLSTGCCGIFHWQPEEPGVRHQNWLQAARDWSQKTGRLPEKHRTTLRSVQKHGVALNSPVQDWGMDASNAVGAAWNFCVRPDIHKSQLDQLLSTCGASMASNLTARHWHVSQSHEKHWKYLRLS